MVKKKIMVCVIEGCKEIDESYTAYCIKHGRSPHRIIEVEEEGRER